MTAILLTNYFILREDRRDENVNILNMVLWIGGFALYRYVLDADTPLGVTFPVVIVIMVCSALLHKLIRK